MYKKLLISLFCFLGITLVLKRVYRPSLWHSYAQQKLNKPARELVQKATTYLSGDSLTALDFGAGVGNETLYLLKKGYTVTAIEPDESVTQLLASRKELQPHKKQLTILNSSFENSNWLLLPPVDLFVASYSLPYVPQKSFTSSVWQEVVNHIKPGGFFVGQFFTPEYKGFADRDRKKMTFLTKTEITNLFEKFTLHHFKLITEEFTNYDGTPVKSSFYEVIAQKST